jgi:CheY-like chemotaxis protein
VTQNRVADVLLAEDNPVIQLVAGAMLAHLGFQGEIAANGVEAVHAVTVASHPYSAILMDCQLPVMDGYEAASEIGRLQSGGRRTPIIAVSVTPMKSVQDRCLAAGMVDYVAKPLTIIALAGVLKRWTSEGSFGGVPIHQMKSRAGLGRGVAGGPPAGRAVLDADVVGRLERLGRETGEDLLGQLATLYLADAGARVVALRHALVHDDGAAVVRSAHLLSGASANMGAAELGRLCAHLEVVGAGGELTGGAAQLQAIESELERVRLALRSWTPAPNR